MTLNDWIYFISGIIWGGWMVRPLVDTVVDIVKTIWKNAKANSK